MNEKQEEVIVRRICESDSAECTGINPCVNCFARILLKVLPGAMRAGGIGNPRPGEDAKALAKAFFDTYAERWKKELELKLTEVEPLPIQPRILKFLAFEEANRKSNEKNNENLSSLEITPTPDTVSVSDPVSTKEEPAKGTKLIRGDLKRIAEKKVKESLAPGNGIPAIDNSGDNRDIVEK